MIEFTKYHGCGNNFVIVKEMQVYRMDYGQLAVNMCNVNTGIGADGLMVVREKPRLEMLFYNKDGSSAPMCGNGIRCFAAFCCNEGIQQDAVYPVQTAAGEMIVTVLRRNPFSVKINMGKPSLDPADFGVQSDSETFLEVPLETEAGTFIANSLFMGTVHTVVWVKDFPSERAGKLISNHSIYSEKTNVNFVKKIDSKTLEIKTYERGAGMTLACGTGACAALAIGSLQGKCDAEVKVLLPYGELDLELLSSGEITMTGPAIKVVEGIYLQEE